MKDFHYQTTALKHGKDEADRQLHKLLKFLTSHVAVAKQPSVLDASLSTNLNTVSLNITLQYLSPEPELPEHLQQSLKESLKPAISPEQAELLRLIERMKQFDLDH